MLSSVHGKPFLRVKEAVASWGDYLHRDQCQASVTHVSESSVKAVLHVSATSYVMVLCSYQSMC